MVSSRFHINGLHNFNHCVILEEPHTSVTALSHESYKSPHQFTNKSSNYWIYLKTFFVALERKIYTSKLSANFGDFKNFRGFEYIKILSQIKTATKA